MEAKKPCIYQPVTECELYPGRINVTITKIKNFFKSQRVKDLEELNSYMALYVKLLQEENQSMVGLAWAHGWRSTEEKIALGIKCRTEIQRLTYKLYSK